MVNTITHNGEFSASNNRDYKFIQNNLIMMVQERMISHFFKIITPSIKLIQYSIITVTIVIRITILYSEFNDHKNSSPRLRVTKTLENFKTYF